LTTIDRKQRCIIVPGEKKQRRGKMLESWAVRKAIQKKIYDQAIIVRVPLEVKQKLEQEAQKKNLSVSDIVRLAIQDWLYKQEGSLG
jgi:predicted HicB family RNase H-like nuclease